MLNDVKENNLMNEGLCAGSSNYCGQSVASWIDQALNESSETGNSSLQDVWIFYSSDEFSPSIYSMSEHLCFYTMDTYDRMRSNVKAKPASRSCGMSCKYWPVSCRQSESHISYITIAVQPWELH